MKRFAQLYAELDASTKTNEKLAALERYWRDASAEDAAWAVSFLSGRRLKRLVPRGLMVEEAARLSGIPDWLFGECYDAVGDLAETIALVLPDVGAEVAEGGLAQWVSRHVVPLAALDEQGRRELLNDAWSRLDRPGRFVYNKLITGAFRVGVSQELVLRSLSRAFDIPPTTLAHRMMGDWAPSQEFFESLIAPGGEDALESRPFPFSLAHPLEGGPEGLGEPSEWLVEWKWDGIRAQAVRRNGQSYLWTRGEELVTDRFPEVAEVVDHLPDGTVLDGEILAFRDGLPLPFLELQRRIGRKTLSRKVLQEVPVVLVAFDLIEFGGEDLRGQPLRDRRQALERLHAQLCVPAVSGFAADLGFGPSIPAWAVSFRLSEALSAATWEEFAELRQSARERLAEGFMLKRLDSEYPVGRKRGFWWKWKIDPLTVDAVVMYAQRGSGRRASLYSDYTFGLWDDGKLVPFAKAYSGLSDEEVRKVDAWVRAHTRERFGPVRTVDPVLVMELAFEGIQLSNRHKSGLAVRFPRIVRWRQDKPPEEADSLQTVKDLLQRSTETRRSSP